MKKLISNVPIVKKAAMSVAILVVLCLIFGASCGGGGQTPNGALPTLHTWDNWADRYSVNGSTYTGVTTVTGQQVYNGIDCYTTQSTITPPLYGISIVTLWIDKATLQEVGGEGQGSYNGIYFTLTTNTSCDYSDKPYPLSVGKTWTVTENTTVTAFMMGQSNISTEMDNYTYKVEGVESVTVPAGTFNCFKIVQYDNNTNAVVDTSWLTYETGGYDIKSTNNIGMTQELTSYSVSK